GCRKQDRGDLFFFNMIYFFNRILHIHQHSGYKCGMPEAVISLALSSKFKLVLINQVELRRFLEIPVTQYIEKVENGSSTGVPCKNDLDKKDWPHQLFGHRKIG